MSEASFVFKCVTLFLFTYNTLQINDYIQHKKIYNIHKLDALKGNDAELKRVIKALDALNNTARGVK